MKSEKIKGYKSFIFLLIIVCMIGFAGFMKADVFASESGADGIRPIEPAPGFDAREIDVKRMAERYFDFVGKVDIKLDDRIVIDDGNFYIAPGKSVSGISEGDTIGIRVNGSGEVIEARRLQK